MQVGDCHCCVSQCNPHQMSLADPKAVHNNIFFAVMRHFFHFSRTFCSVHKPQMHHARATSTPHLICHLQLCCICRNERDHVVVSAPLMRCQVIYLWITWLEQPPCAVCFFFFLFGVMSLSDCWCNSLSSRVCPHLLWAFGEGYIHLGMSLSVLEVGVTHWAGVSIHSHTATCQTRALQLISSCREESW